MLVTLDIHTNGRRWPVVTVAPSWPFEKRKSNITCGNVCFLDCCVGFLSLSLSLSLVEYMVRTCSSHWECIPYISVSWDPLLCSRRYYSFCQRKMCSLMMGPADARVWDTHVGRLTCFQRVFGLPSLPPCCFSIDSLREWIFFFGFLGFFILDSPYPLLITEGGEGQLMYGRSWCLSCSVEDR